MESSNSNVLLPLNFYCRNARFCMKKAAFSKKACLASDELAHLKKFYTLLTSTIPSHPQFEAQRTEKQLVELLTCLPETRKRMLQLEGEVFSSPTNTNTNIMANSTTKPSVKDGSMKNVKGIKKTLHRARPLPLPSFCIDDPQPPTTQQQQQQQQHRPRPQPQEQKPQKQKRLGSKGISFTKKPRKRHEESPHDSSEDLDADMDRFINKLRVEIEQDNSPSTANSPSTPKTTSSPLLRRVPNNPRIFSSPRVKNESSAKRTLISQRADTSLNVASSTDNDYFHLMKYRDVSRRKSGHVHTNSDLYQQNLDEATSPLRSHSHRHRLSTVTMPSLSSSSLFNPQSPATESGFNLPNHHVLHTPLQLDQEGGYTDHTTSSCIDPRNVKTYQRNGPFTKDNSGDNLIMFPESLDHGNGIKNVEPMQKEWVNSSSSRRSSCCIQTRNYRLNETNNDRTNAPRNDVEERVSNVEDMVAVTDHIRRKLDEEYGKMRDQMKWLKRKDASCLQSREPSKIINPKGINPNGTQASIGQNNNDITSLNGSSSVLCGHGHNVDDEVKSLYDEDEERQKDYVNTPPQGSLFEEKVPEHKHTANANVSNSTKHTPSDAPFDTSLPFSHYLSKLKELSGRRNASTSLPSIDTSCNTAQISESNRRESPSSSKHETLHLSASFDRGWAVRESLETSPHSDAFSEALTYSNPVFDLGGELMREETGSAQRIGGVEDECLQEPTLGAHGLTTEEKNDGKNQRDIVRRASTSIHSPSATRTEGHKLLHQTQWADENLRESEAENAQFIISGHRSGLTKTNFMKKFQAQQEISSSIEEASLSANYTNLPLYIDRDIDESCGIQNDTNKSNVDPMGEGLVCFQMNSARQVPLETKAKETSPEYNALDPHVLVLDKESSRLIQCKIEELQQVLKDHKDLSEKERAKIKGMIDRDVCDKMVELAGTVQWAKDLLIVEENERQRLENKVGNCEIQFKSLQEQMDVFSGEMKGVVMDQMKTNTLNELKDVSICKERMEAIEKNISKSVETLRSELVSSMESVREELENRFERNRDALESLVIQKIDEHTKDYSPFITLSDDIRDTIAKMMQAEVCSVWEEIHGILKDKDELEEQVEKLTNIANNARECIIRDNSVLSKELKRVKKECLKSKQQNKEMRQAMEGIKQIFEASLTQMREESQASQTKGEEDLKRMEDNLRKESLDHGMLLGRVDELSHFYQCAFEEVRGDLLHLKMVAQEKLEEIEYRWEGFVREQHHNTMQKCNSSLHDLAIDGLKSRIQEVEKTVGTLGEAGKAQIEAEDLRKEMTMLKDTLILVEKDKEVVSWAANEAMAAANRAEKVLEELSKVCEESCAHSSASKEGVNCERMNEERIEELISAVAKVMQGTSELDEKHKEHEVSLEEIRKEVVNYERMNEERIEELDSAIAKVMQNVSELNEKHKEHQMFIHEIRKEVTSATARVIQNTSELDVKHKEQEMFLHEIKKEVEARNEEQKDLVKRVYDVCEKVDASSNRIEHSEIEKKENSWLAREMGNHDVSQEKLVKLLNSYEEMSCFFKELKKMKSGDGGGENKNDKNGTKQDSEVTLNALGMKVEELENRICHVETAATLTTRTLDSKTHFFTAQIEIALTAAMKAEGKCSALGSELVKLFRALASSKKKRYSKPIQSEENNHELHHHHNQAVVVRDPFYKKRTTTKEQHSVGTKESAGFERNVKQDTDISAQLNNQIVAIEGQELHRNEALDTNRSGSTATNTTHTKTSFSNISNLGTNLSTIETFTDPSSSYATQHSIHGHDHHERSIVKVGRIFKLATKFHSHNKQESDDQYITSPTKASAAATTIATYSAINSDQGRCINVDGVKTQNDTKMVIVEGKLPITEGKAGKRRIECTRKERIRIGCANTDYQMTDLRMDKGRILVNVCHQSAFVSGTRTRVVT